MEEQSKSVLLAGEEKSKPDYRFPELTSQAPAGLFIDPDTSAAWLGIALTKMDYLHASAILDDAKFKLLSFYDKAMNSDRIVKPGIGGMMNNLKKRFLH